MIKITQKRAEKVCEEKYKITETTIMTIKGKELHKGNLKGENQISNTTHLLDYHKSENVNGFNDSKKKKKTASRSKKPV